MGPLRDEMRGHALARCREIILQKWYTFNVHDLRSWDAIHVHRTYIQHHLLHAEYFPARSYRNVIIRCRLTLHFASGKPHVPVVFSYFGPRKHYDFVTTRI